MIKDVIPLMPHTIDEIIAIIGPRATKHVFPMGGRVSIRMAIADSATGEDYMDFFYSRWMFEISESGACSFVKPVNSEYRKAICVKPARVAGGATADTFNPANI